MSTDKLRAAIVEYCQDEFDIDPGDIVTDFVVVAGWINLTAEQHDGILIACSDGTPGYTQTGLLKSAEEVDDDGSRE